MKQNAQLLAFNRGVISPLALGRIDIKRLAMAAEEQTNWLPRTLGPMSLRPGLQYILNTYGNNTARYLPFIFSVGDQALLELTDSIMRIVVSDALVSRDAVSTAFTNGGFNTDVTTGWTDSSDVGGSVAWATGGYAQLTGDGTNFGALSQTLSVAAGDIGKAHGIRIVVNRGSCQVRIGSTSGGDEYVAQTTLLTGTHSLQINPTGDMYVKIMSSEPYPVLVDSLAVEASGVVTLPTPWTAADLDNISFDESADVIYVACNGVRQQRIERRGVHSWSVCDFVCDDGPFLVQNITPTTLEPSALTGSITLTASKALFTADHVGALFRLISAGQKVVLAISSADTYTNPIEVTGLTAKRAFGIVITGLTGTGNTVTLQQSIGAVGAWVDVANYTTNQSTSYNDSLDNQIVYYRLGIKAGAYSSGTTSCTLSYSYGTTTGIARVIGYTSSTVVSAVVETPLGSTTATSDWSEGSWSAKQGYPSAVVLYEGRLWWAGSSYIWGSVSDAYTSNDDTTVGDSGPLNRAIGSGPVDNINWLLPMIELIVGAQMAELPARSNALLDPLTPTNFNLKGGTTIGSTNVQPLKLDQQGIFVNRSGSRVFEIAADAYTSRFSANDLTLLTPEICQPYLVRSALQRNIDNRLHFVRSDGKAVIMVYEKAEDVNCWVLIETTGYIEDVIVMPSAAGVDEDSVYYVVKRTINGSTVRFLEKWARQNECIGAAANKQADAFYHYSGAATTTATAAHLPNTDVVVWADGKDVGTHTLDASGVLTLTTAASEIVFGLGYQARFKSAKLAYAAQGGSALTQVKRVDHLGVILQDTHYQGLQYGSDYSNLDDLPLVEDGAVTAADTVWSSYDNQSVEFDGTYDTDSRVCLVANAPRCCTVKAAILDIQTNEKV